jgi:hypothetical protein
LAHFTPWTRGAEQASCFTCRYAIGLPWPGLGVGTGYRWLEATSGPAAHLFIGVPIGLPIIDHGIMYAEPYYRPQFSFRFQERTHEVGMLMKVIFQHKKR